MKRKALFCAWLVLTGTALAEDKYVFKAGHPSLKEWLLPKQPSFPADNAPSPARLALGKKLFFDPRLSGDGNMSCATCHNPSLGWADGMATARGVKSTVLGRASPTVINTAYNNIQMWDGRKKSLEDQATGPMESNMEMNRDLEALVHWLKNNAEYRTLFRQAYPGEPIAPATVAKAIAQFERTAISRDSRFDRWVRGDAKALNEQEINGFKLFVGKANCALCHMPPNFTDNGFHNLGLASWGNESPDPGRHAIKPLKIVKGAFKTPTIREIERTAPYFHDGSAKTLMDVVEHYNKGGEVTNNLSPNIKPLNLTEQEKADLVVFMGTLSSPYLAVTLPELPHD